MSSRADVVYALMSLRADGTAARGRAPRPERQDPAVVIGRLGAVGRHDRESPFAGGRGSRIGAQSQDFKGNPQLPPATVAATLE